LQTKEDALRHGVPLNRKEREAIARLFAFARVRAVDARKSEVHPCSIPSAVMLPELVFFPDGLYATPLHP